ncbi:SMI1/KNR4 family protein [Streptomyces sp. NPDC048680]|uniref:SMI1/KNR4 family protein n=1 Tax=Streptomyces sp. NPDC048680 TaxID=3155492 RepID=UPI00341F8682
MRTHALGDFSALRPGASVTEIATLEAGTGFPPDPALASLLSMHNGAERRRSSGSPGALLLGYSLLPVDRIIESHAHLVSLANDAVEDGYEEEVIGRIAHPRWVPFAQALTGDLLFIDHRTDGFGAIGEMSFADPDYAKQWPSLPVMLRDLCSAVEDPTPVSLARRFPSLHENRMVEWVKD